MRASGRKPERACVETTLQGKLFTEETNGNKEKSKEEKTLTVSETILASDFNAPRGKHLPRGFLGDRCKIAPFPAFL
jgi:hypothetical protein